MSLVALAAGRGSRGVTTATLALAATWPVPALVAECDPAGGSLAALFGLRPLPGMLSLAVAARHGLEGAAVAGHVRSLPLGLPVLIGPSSAEQAAGLAGTWRTVAPVLAGLPDVDVLADCGRIGPDPPTLDLLRHADLVVLVAEPNPDGLQQLKDRAVALASTLAGSKPGSAGHRCRVVVLLLGDRPYPPAEVRAWLAEQRVAVEVAGALADDPRAAAMLTGMPGRGDLRRSLLLRSASTVATQLRDQLLQRPGPPTAAASPAGPAGPAGAGHTLMETSPVEASP